MSKRGSGKAGTIPFTAKRKGKPKPSKGKSISPAEAAARARQSERDKLRSQVGAFTSSKFTTVTKMKGRRFCYSCDPEDASGDRKASPGGLLDKLNEDIELASAMLKEWDTPVIEIKRLQVALSFKDEPFILVHSAYCKPGFNFGKSTKDVGELSPRLCASKAGSKHMVIAWTPGEYGMVEFCPCVLIERLDGVETEESFILEVSVEWRVKGK